MVACSGSEKLKMNVDQSTVDYLVMPQPGEKRVDIASEKGVKDDMEVIKGIHDKGAIRSWVAIRDENGTQFSSYSMKKLKKISCCSDLWHFDHQLRFELTGLSNENTTIEAIWINTKPGDLIVSSGEWHILATAIDCAHDDDEEH